MNERITSREVDGAIRPGLNDLRDYFSGNVEAKDKAEMFLKGVRVGGQRMSAENNQLLMALKLGKAANATPEQMRPAFDAIMAQYSASAGVIEAAGAVPVQLESGS